MNLFNLLMPHAQNLNIKLNYIMFNMWTRLNGVNNMTNFAEPITQCHKSASRDTCIFETKVDNVYTTIYYPDLNVPTQYSSCCCRVDADVFNGMCCIALGVWFTIHCLYEPSWKTLDWKLITRKENLTTQTIIPLFPLLYTNDG